jgi:hypothetical protein
LIDDNARQFSDAGESVEDAVLRKLAEDELHRALEKLTDEEYALIYALFFEGKSIRAYAQELGVYPNAVHTVRGLFIRTTPSGNLENRIPIHQAHSHYYCQKHKPR